MRNKEQITTIMKGGCSKSGTWKYFDQHLVNRVKYGRCKDETCPGKSQKNRRKTECDIGGEILIRCTGSNTASLWYHLQVYHPETYKAAYKLKEKNKKEKEEEEMAAFHFSQGKKKTKCTPDVCSKVCWTKVQERSSFSKNFQSGSRGSDSE